jgi:hypothetical protein
MKLFSPKCPVSADEKLWIENSMLWLLDEFSEDTLRNAIVVLPTPEYFPDSYSGQEEDARALVRRVCGYMDVDFNRLELIFHPDDESELRSHIPSLEFSGKTFAGHYQKRRGKFFITIKASQLRDPISLVATVAHELGHVLLLGGGRVSPHQEDHEPLTDLLTVFLGLGIFTANSAFNFSQWTDGFGQGWQAQRQGYISEEMFGYSLALFAWLRGEHKPEWSKHLETNVRAFFKKSLDYLERTGDTQLQKLQP